MKFENLLVWQNAQSLSIEIYKLFKSSKDFSFRDQICRATISISSNIAEGYERQSQKELKQFLYIAKGSSGEVRSLLSIAIELQYIKKDYGNLLINKCTEISKMLSGFINKVDKELKNSL